MRALATVMFVLASCLPVTAQQDADAAKDHPMLSRLPGYYIEEYDAQDFSTHELDLDPARKVEGRYWRISYWLKENAKKVGPVQIARNYTSLFVQRGGRVLLDDVDASGGTTIAQLPVKGKSIWLEVSVSNDGEVYELVVVEEAGMEQSVEFTATELASALEHHGTVAVHGILFDTGKATIQKESADTLATIVELLRGQPALALELRGHTDNVGGAAANLKLSQDRAASVKTYLVQAGIATARLTTAGVGDAKPIADNATEEGRRQNRRVELVKR